MNKKIVQTAGKEQLGEFAPMFAHLNDDILFGKVWNETAIDVKTKCIITVVSLMASGITDTSLTYHLQNAKANGVTKEEIAAIITHATMYVGWPKGWAVFRLAKDVWNEEAPAMTEKENYQNTIFFPIGEPNDAFAQYFVGQSYLAPVSTEQVPIFNVTFEPACRNNWHIHRAKSGGGQMLICVGGRGYYQELGKEAIEMNPGDVINIPANVKHWHGAAPDSWFSHLAVEINGEETGNEWLEEVSDEDYGKLK
ncbi:MAG: carboxymuconolactone decarboxylase family protein [Ruminococcus sp.]|nr:carboxymuconolactone decarboxylase family protein [Ruminococcus sp.]